MSQEDNKLEEGLTTADYVEAWVGDPDFWKGVVIQVIGTLVAAGIIAVSIAASTASIYSPEVRFQILAPVVSFGLIALVGVTGVHVGRALIARLPWGRRSFRSRNVGRLIWAALFVVGYVVWAAIGYVAVLLLSSYVGYEFPGFLKWW